MKRPKNEHMTETIRQFRLPRYDELPWGGFYLEQTAQYISGLLAPLKNITITSSMISNYVKKGLVANPIRKQYNREQIAYLIYIAIAKSVLSLDDIRLLITIQKRSYESQVAYDYLCCELENMLQHVFGLKNAPEIVGTDDTEEKTMLRNTIITVAHKIYLDEYFAALHIKEDSL